MNRRSTHTPELAERNAAIKRAHASGELTYAQIAKRYGLTPARVKSIVKDPYSTTSPTTWIDRFKDFEPILESGPERVEQMRSLRDEGLTLNEIGTIFGVTRARVHQVLARADERAEEAPPNGQRAS